MLVYLHIPRYRLNALKQNSFKNIKQITNFVSRANVISDGKIKSYLSKIDIKNANTINVVSANNRMIKLLFLKRFE